MLYDSFLLIAIAMLSTAILLGFTGGEILKGLAYQLFLYLEIFFFYFTFWKVKGQTLGMQVWKIKTVNDEGGILTSTQCVIRFLAATVSIVLFGAGFFWALFSRDRSCWHDRLSGTHVIYLGKRPYQSEQ